MEYDRVALTRSGDYPYAEVFASEIENKLRDELQSITRSESEEEKLAMLREGDATAFSDMTDRENSNFKYNY